MKLFFRKSGTGKPVIILHGLFGMSDNWVSFAKRFPEKYQVILPDLRNHGQSPHSPDFSYELMAEDLHELVIEEKLEDIILTGHSLGGKLAMVFALKYPTLISKLIVIDMAPRFYPPHHQHVFDALERVNLSEISSRSEAALKLDLPDESTRLFLLKNLFRSPTNPSVFAWRFNLRAIHQHLAEIGKEIMHLALSSPNPTPYATLFIKAEKSAYIRLEDENKIKMLFPTAEMIEIPEAGHWVHADKPDELFEIMFHFIEN